MTRFRDYFRFYKIEKTIINPITTADKTIFICRCDLIGDYIASRHLYKKLKESDTYKNYKITLLCNSVIKDFALEFDSPYIDEFIWFSRNEFFSNKVYRKFLKKELSKRDYDILINPQYSRDYTCEEVVKMVNAKEKICMHGDNYNLSEYQRSRYDLNYTNVIKNTSAKNMYLVMANELLQALTGTECKMERPEISLKNEKFTQIDFDWQIPYVIMFPFARTSERILKTEVFIELAEYLFNRHNLVTYCCGSNEDSKKVQKTNKKFIKNICGKYSLSQLPYIFNKAKLVLTNDTMAVHIASGVNDNVLCFSNGKFIVNKQLHSIKNNVGKEIFFFDAPYKGVKTICPTKLYDDIQKNIFDYESNFFESSYDINDINIDNAKNIIDYTLSAR